MDKLSPRQESILNRVVDTHIETGQPVGSKAITELYTELYRGSYSSATVRYEMLRLEDQGYLTHPHTSAGRVPTDRGYRYYVDHGIQDRFSSGEALSGVGRDLEGCRDPMESFAAQVSRALSQTAESLSLILISAPSRESDRGREVFSMRGTGHILDHAEDLPRPALGSLFQFMEDRPRLLEWLGEKPRQTGVCVEIGCENTAEAFRQCTVISAPIFGRDLERGTLAVVGPRRLRYARLIPLVREMARTVSRVLDLRGLEREDR